MSGSTEIVERLVRAINGGDLEAALACYEPTAAMLAQPGQLARGGTQLREALAGFIAMKPTLRTEAREVIEAGDLALYLSRWSLSGTDPAGQPVAMGGESTDVLRRQPDGGWRIALDNPWGTRILGPG